MVHVGRQWQPNKGSDSSAIRAAENKGEGMGYLWPSCASNREKSRAMEGTAATRKKSLF